jgi:hypothetical protein
MSPNLLIVGRVVLFTKGTIPVNVVESVEADDKMVGGIVGWGKVRYILRCRETSRGVEEHFPIVGRGVGNT